MIEIEFGEEIDLEEAARSIKVPDTNTFISDENKAVELISLLIRNQSDHSHYFRRKIENQIDQLFSLFSEVTIDNVMVLYERFKALCSRIIERQKIRRIRNKVVISFGGKVSSGKSRFINTISGIGNKLPVDQKTTTAIPTYIIKSNTENIEAVSVYGYSTKILPEALNAMAHEFDAVYGIGFPAFVDCIIIQSNECSLGEKIALLDTPGYTKYDEEGDSKRIISDRERSYNQLNISDYLIWLIDIDSGAITADDIEFMESLSIKTPILIVFTKADLKTNSEIHQIIDVAKETIERTRIQCYGITAYSANMRTEIGNNLIQTFLNYTLSSSIRNSDIVNEFLQVEEEMRNIIEMEISKAKNTAKSLFSYISKSDKVMETKSLAMLWGEANQKGFKLEMILRKYNQMMGEMNSEIDKYFRNEE